MRHQITSRPVLLAALPVVLAWKPFPSHNIADVRQIITKRDVQAGGKCGLYGGNSICAAGLCCSEQPEPGGPGGVCGIGGDFCVSPGCQLDFGPACDGNKSPPGQDTSAIPRPLFGDVPYGSDVSTCKSPGKVALTFDDGPNKFTNDLLDILKKNNVKATFFITGANGGKGQIEDPATGFPAAIMRMRKEGHQIGSHSWSHQDLRNLTAGQRQDQIVKNEIALVDIMGFFPTYLRPPFTKWNDEVIADLERFGYHNVQLNFNLNTDDWEGNYTAARDAFSSAVSQKSPETTSFIVVSHDTHEQTVHNYVQYMIDQAREHKYELVTVGECLGDPPNNWYRDAKTGQQFDGPPPPPPKVVVASSGGSSSTSLASTRQSVGSTPTESLSASTALETTPPSAAPSTSSHTSVTNIRSASTAATVTAASAPKPNSMRRNRALNSLRVILIGGLVFLVHRLPFS